jgi:large subunit ribosomal protein L3
MLLPLVARKLGMASLYSEDGRICAVTILETVDCHVLRKKSNESDGYSALVVGYGKLKLPKATKPHCGLFKKLSVDPLKYLKEFRLSEEDLAEFSAGEVVSIAESGIRAGQLVDVIGKSIGKGFSGVIKRHHFSGLEASHGVSLSHRAHGSTGGRQDPGKVFKNKKMAGHLGDKRITTRNLRVMSIDATKKLVVLFGAVPGCKGSEVLVRDPVY